MFAEQQLTGYGYTTTQQNWRRIAHIISDEIYKRITGEDGYFDTRIVYVSESGPSEKRTKRLAIMDQDGANNRFLTDGRALVLTPRFSPTAQEITYLSYGSGAPRVYLFNIDTGQQEAVGDFPGMTFAPRFSPWWPGWPPRRGSGRPPDGSTACCSTPQKYSARGSASSNTATSSTGC